MNPNCKAQFVQSLDSCKQAHKQKHRTGFDFHLKDHTLQVWNDSVSWKHAETSLIIAWEK